MWVVLAPCMVLRVILGTWEGGASASDSLAIEGSPYS